VSRTRDKATIPITDENKIVEILVKWWEKKYGMNEGSRSNNLFKLASAFNDFGVNKSECESVLSQFEQSDFKLSEITSIIKSAYRNTSNFRTKFFEDANSKQKIEKLIRSGKKESEIANSFPELKPEQVSQSLEQIKEKISINDFWQYDKNGKINLSPHRYKYWLEQNNFFKYYLFMVTNKFILFTFLFFCYFISNAQNSFYDDIRLMDYQRNKQLLTHFSQKE
jgi:hypothetical protein